MPIDLTLEQLAALEQINFDDYDAAQTCRRWMPQLVAMARKALALEKLTTIDAENRIAELMADNEQLRREWKNEETACDAADLLLDGLRAKLDDYAQLLSACREVIAAYTSDEVALQFEKARKLLGRLIATVPEE